MKIELYKTNSEKNALTKKLTKIATYNGSNRNKNEVGKANIELTVSITNLQHVRECNYVYCEELERYYWVKDINNISGTVYIMSCTVDPLMSFKEQILGCEGTLSRSTNISDKYIQDPMDLQYQNTNIVYRTFKDSEGHPTQLNETSVILITC